MELRKESFKTLNFPIDARSSVETLNRKSKISLRLLMSCRETGCIIGKNGIAITSFRKKSGAVIKISDKGGTERIVTICGHSSEVNSACKHICEKLELAFMHRKYMPDDCQNVTNAKARVIIRLLIPSTFCGFIIGKSGSNLKNIIKLTGSRVKISSRVVPNSTERVLFTIGSATAVCKCLMTICNLIFKISSSTKSVPYCPPLFAANSHAAQKGSHLQIPNINRRPNKKCRMSEANLLGYSAEILRKTFATKAKQSVKISPDYNLAEIPDKWSIHYDQMANKDARMENEARLTKQTAVSSIPNISPTNSINSLYYDELRIWKFLASTSLPTNIFLPTAHEIAEETFPKISICSRSNQDLFNITSPTPSKYPQETQKTICISNEIVGCVIGRGGKKINEIRRISHAKIKIGGNEPSSTFRQITIIGNNNSIEVALSLIKESLIARSVLT